MVQALTGAAMVCAGAGAQAAGLCDPVPHHGRGPRALPAPDWALVSLQVKRLAHMKSSSFAPAPEAAAVRLLCDEEAHTAGGCSHSTPPVTLPDVLLK